MGHSPWALTERSEGGAGLGEGRGGEVTFLSESERLGGGAGLSERRGGVVALLSDDSEAEDDLDLDINDSSFLR